MPERSARMRDGTPEGAARVGTAARTQRVIVGSSRICGLPSLRKARNASPGIFVFWYAHGDKIPKDVPNNAVVAGVPAKIISYKGSVDRIGNTDYEGKIP